jgi:hypothetical protein
MTIEDIEYPELENLLRDWTSMEGEAPYDFVGMVHLFRACLLNLIDNSTEHDWSEVVELFEPAERQFLTGLVQRLQRAG